MESDVQALDEAHNSITKRPTLHKGNDFTPGEDATLTLNPTLKGISCTTSTATPSSLPASAPLPAAKPPRMLPSELQQQSMYAWVPPRQWCSHAPIRVNTLYSP